MIEIPSHTIAQLLYLVHTDPEELREALGELRAPDIAEALRELPPEAAAKVMASLPFELAVQVFDEPELTRHRCAITQLIEPRKVGPLIEAMSADQQADLFREVPPEDRPRLLATVSEPTRAALQKLLQYPAETAGGIMTTEFVQLNPGLKVGEALKHIRAVAREKESIYACYVLEPDTGKLLGSVSLRDLVMAELDAPVTQVMRRKPVTVSAEDDQEAVAQKIGKYNLLAVPVLEKDGNVVGFVTVDDVIDVLIEEQTEDIMRMAAVGSDALDKPYFDNPILRVVRKRIGWLLLLFVAGTLTSAVLHRFEDELAAVVALAFFIPLLIGTGGNAGAQTVMTVIRSLALGEVGVRQAWRVVLREATTGVVVGLLVGAVAFGQALLWQAPMALALTVSVTMFAICVWSTTVGSLIPILAHRFGVDPAVLSAPLITTLVDATGLIIYFSIAKLILRV